MLRARVAKCFTCVDPFADRLATGMRRLRESRRAARPSHRWREGVAASGLSPA